VVEGPPDGAPLTAAIDPAQVERIVENLLVNVARHCPPGSTATVRVSESRNGVLVSVDDEGPGVPDDLKVIVFEPFRRGRDPHAPGTGIGLSLVARFAELHGGRAWVEDRPGGGASFRVLLAHDGTAGQSG
jgi:signal transduction histidine kinase